MDRRQENPDSQQQADPDSLITAARPTGLRVAGLDGVRGVAVILVVFSHAGVPLFGAGGIEGVTTFFTLSGFLITGLLLKEHRVTGRLDLPAFWGRRALRLLPALFTFVGVTGLFFWVAGWGGRAAVIAWSRPVLLYYGNIAMIEHGQSALGPFRHTWSLAVEEQFYLVWPLVLTPVLMLLCRRRSGWLWLLVGMFALTVMSLGWRLVGGSTGPQGGWVGIAPHTTVFSMTAGAALAVLHERGWRAGRWAGPVAPVVLSAYFWVPEAFPRYAGWVTGPAIYTGLALVLIAGTAGQRRTIFSWRPLRAVGTVSYSWYLWHFPFTLVLVAKMFTVRHLTIALWLGMLVSLLIAALSWRYVERPLQRRFRGRLERVRLAVTPPSVAGDPGSDVDPAPSWETAAVEAHDAGEGRPGSGVAASSDEDPVIDLTAAECRVRR